MEAACGLTRFSNPGLVGKTEQSGSGRERDAAGDVETEVNPELNDLDEAKLERVEEAVNDGCRATP